MHTDKKSGKWIFSSCDFFVSCQPKLFFTFLFLHVFFFRLCVFRYVSFVFINFSLSLMTSSFAIILHE